MRAVVLLSGGLDSTTCLGMARAEGRDVTALSFSYGQRHSAELGAARRVAAAAGVDDHRIIELDPAPFAASSLTSGGDVPVDRDVADESIPSTYVPARNTVFLAMALGVAETVDAGEIWIGVNALDYSGYPDCRPEFIAAFQAVADVATAVAVEGRPPQIRAPLIDMTKAQIIEAAGDVGVDLALTVSCYLADATGAACGRCDSCRLRAQGFAAAGVDDPTRYQQS